MHEPNQVPHYSWGQQRREHIQRGVMGRREKVQRGLSLELSLERSSELPVREVTKRRRGVRGAPTHHTCTSRVLSESPPSPARAPSHPQPTALRAALTEAKDDEQPQMRPSSLFI